MSVKKIAVVISLLLYLVIIAVWCYRFPISYKVVGGDPSLIENRDLTSKEYNRIDEAYRIRLKVSNLLLYSSLFVYMGSYILRRRWVRKTTIKNFDVFIRTYRSYFDTCKWHSFYSRSTYKISSMFLTEPKHIRDFRFEIL